MNGIGKLSFKSRSQPTVEVPPPPTPQMHAAANGVSKDQYYPTSSNAEHELQGVASCDSHKAEEAAKETSRSSALLKGPPFSNAELSNKATATYPKVKADVSTMYVNFLVCGQAGTGKTTCISNLLSSYSNGKAEGLLFKNDTSRSKFDFDTFSSAPETLMTELPPVPIEGKNMNVVYRIQETPGYGNNLNAGADISVILDYIRKRKQAQFQELHGHTYPSSIVPSLQHMVDACLYFIRPDGITLTDVKFMSDLAKEVTVIPVIGKADGMTVEETKSFKSKVLQMLKDPPPLPDGPIDPVPRFTFGQQSEDLMNSNLALGPVPPFAIVCSREYKDDRKLEPIRKYFGGTCESFNPDHSDLAVFKDMLTCSGFQALADEKRRFYEIYVEHVDQWNAEAAEDKEQQLFTLHQENEGYRAQLQRMRREYQEAMQQEADRATQMAEEIRNLQTQFGLERDRVSKLNSENQQLKTKVEQAGCANCTIM